MPGGGDGRRGGGGVPVPSVGAARRATEEPPPRRRRVAPLAVLATLAGLVGIAMGSAAVVALSSDPAPEPRTPPPIGPPDMGLDGGLDAGSPAEDAGAAIPLEETAAPDPGPECPGLTGRWAGRWSASTSRGTWTAEFTRSRGDDGAPELHGDIAVVGTACGRGGHIVGRIRDDCSVEFDPYSTGPCRVRYTATFDGDRMHGTLSASGFGMADSGRWSGSRRGGGAAPQP